MRVIALYLLAAHLVGDFVLQTRWQAAGKFDDRELRTAHVFFYGIPFLPILFWRIYAAPRVVWWHAPAFFALLLLLHYLTDSRRFRSTLGDIVGWARMPASDRGAEVVASWPLADVRILDLDLPTGPSPQLVQRTPVGPLRLPPNPWPPMPLLIDQTLHVCQVALLAGIFLS